MHERWKVMPDAAAADALARELCQAYAAQSGKPYPIPPDRYGGGRQPQPREAYYHTHLVRPVDNLVPATPEAIALGGSRMNGHVRFEDLPQSDRDKIVPPDRATPAPGEVGRARALSKSPGLAPAVLQNTQQRVRLGAWAVDARWMAGLQLLLGTTLILVAVLHPDVRADQGVFGMVIALGSGLIGNVPKGPLERRSNPPPPPLGR